MEFYKYVAPLALEGEPNCGVPIRTVGGRMVMERCAGGTSADGASAPSLPIKKTGVSIRPTPAGIPAFSIDPQSGCFYT